MNNLKEAQDLVEEMKDKAQLVGYLAGLEAVQKWVLRQASGELNGYQVKMLKSLTGELDRLKENNNERWNNG